MDQGNQKITLFSVSKPSLIKWRTAQILILQRSDEAGRGLWRSPGPATFPKLLQSPIPSQSCIRLPRALTQREFPRLMIPQLSWAIPVCLNTGPHTEGNFSPCIWIVKSYLYTSIGTQRDVHLQILKCAFSRSFNKPVFYGSQMNYSLETSEFTCTHITFKNNFKTTEANKKPRLQKAEPAYNNFIFNPFLLPILAQSLFKSHCATKMVNLQFFSVLE